MGIFSSKTVTTITGVTQRLLEDKDFISSKKRAIRDWIWNGNKSLGVNLDDKDMTDYILEYHQKTLPKQFNKIYRFANKPDKYIFGLPTSALTKKPEELIIKATQKYIKEQNQNNSIEFYKTFVGDKDYYISAWLSLVNHYEYDSQTNEIKYFSRIKGKPCYLYDGILYLKRETLELYRDSPITNKSLPFSYGHCFNREKDITRQQTDHEVYHKELMAIEFCYEDNGNIIHEVFAIPLSDLYIKLQEGQNIGIENDYVYATYLINNKYHWFEYGYLSGLIYDIDTALQAKNTLGEYYPRLYIRLQQNDIINSRDKRWVNDSKNIYKKLGLDLKDMTEQIKKGVGDGDWGDVRGLFLFMGVSVNQAQNDKILSEYLYKYFKRIYNNMESYTNDETQAIIDENPDLYVEVRRTSSAIQNISDNVSTQTVQFGYIEYQLLSGLPDGIDINIGEYKAIYHTYQVTSDNKLRKMFNIHERRHEHLFYYRQTDNRLHLYKVYQLNIGTYISGYGFKEVGNSHQLVIPLDKTIMNELTAKEEEYLFHRAFHLSMVHVKVTKKKWHQSGIFRVVMVAVTLAITAITHGGGLVKLGILIKSLAVSTVKSVIINYAINSILKFAVKVGIIDAKTVNILSFVISVFMVFKGGGFNFKNILTAPNVMKLVNLSFNAYNNLLQAQTQDALKQLNQLELDYKKQQDYLKKKQKLLETKVFDLDQELIRSSFMPTVNLFETPEMFYSRHYNYNVIELTHGLITNYVDGSLQIKQPYLVNDEPVEDILLIT